MTGAPARALAWLALAHAAIACGGNQPRVHPASSALATARFSRIDDETGGALGDRDLEIGAIDLHARTAIGDALPSCAGLDATLGASSTGLVYAADAYVFGLVLPSAGLGGAPGWLSVCAGFGFSGVRGSIPFAWEFPAELSADLPLGPITFRGWGRASLVASSEARRDGTEATAGFADEYTAGFDIRFSRLGQRGGLVVPGGVPVVGLTWGEVMGSTFSGAYVGIGASRSR
ncbi:MAG TPA: hypothetical protein VFU21_14890 [Kofleriaceae bacterium]|nr:hypothetical protein [Kofleriaceae bacterium]